MSAPTRDEMRVSAILFLARTGQPVPAADVLWLLEFLRLLPPALGVDSSKIGSLCSAPERGGSLTYCGCPYCERPHTERT